MKWLMLALTACSAAPASVPSVSSTLALTADDRGLWVVNPDSDSVSLIDPRARTLVAEVALAAVPPAVDAQTMRYEPSVKPRALALLPGDHKLYVAGQTANQVFVVDTATRTVQKSIAVGAAPVGVVAAPDGSAVYVVSHEAATVSKIDPRTDQVTATLPVGEHPWGASISADGKSLYVSQFLLHAGVTVVDTASFRVRTATELAEQPFDATQKLLPSGVARGVYAAVPHPRTRELWLVHMLLAIKNPQPNLDFQSTAFPTISILSPAGAERRRLLFKPLLAAGATGAFTDSISGPRALAFSPDGKLALMANAGSEDVMVFDGTTGDETLLVRPLPATFLEGIVFDHAGTHAYVDGRSSHNVAVLTVQPQNPLVPVAVDGDPIERLRADPMPAQLRLGQRLFYSANSAAYPLTQNFWISCATCHLEGGTDAVTWLFGQGPRDTPSNAGGPINTGFLFRQATRNDVTQYDKTIRVEQGGHFDRTLDAQKPLLAALAAFVNYAIPFPQNPNRAADGSLSASQQRGQTIFAARCASCHSGAFYTDSGAGNPTLDMSGTVTLHDVGTCVHGSAFDDQPATDDLLGKPRTPCDFDTPTLRGVFATPPYFHDGSAATLGDVVERLPFSIGLGAGDKSDLVAFLETL
jgi:YVTN family beta-propeller protein